MGKIAFSSLPDRLRTHITSINPGLLAKVTSALCVIVQHAAESGDGRERLIDYVDLMNMVMYKFQDDPIFRYDSFKWISLIPYSDMIRLNGYLWMECMSLV